MIKKGTRFFTPDTINDLKKTALNEEVVTILAGGTSLFREINGENLVIPGAIIVLENIVELYKESRTERYFEFGSMLTINQIIERSKNNLPSTLLNCFLSLAPDPVRNQATIGGTIANKKIVSDLTSILVILNTKIEIISFSEKKIKPRWESISQYLTTRDSKPLHLITRVRIPLVHSTYSHYSKSGYKYNLFSEISFAANAELEKSNISSISLAFVIENRKIVRPKEIEAELIGTHIPVSYKFRDTLLHSIITKLKNIPNLTNSEIFRMSQMILYFLDNF